MTAQELMALLALGFMGSFTPGPNTALSTAVAANHGLRGALPFVCAVPCGWGLLLLASSAGLGALVQEYPPLRWLLVMGGAAYLLWLARRLTRIRAWTGPADGALPIRFVAGLMLQFLNPKAWLLAISVASGWVLGFDNATQRLLQALPVFMGFGLISNLTYALMGTALREWLQGPDHSARRLVVFNHIMALGLVATGAWMVRGLWTA